METLLYFAQEGAAEIGKFWELLEKAQESPVIMTIFISVVGWLWLRFRLWKPKYAKIIEDHQGQLHAVVRAAEMAIPNNTPNKSKRRMDVALRLFSKAMDRDKKDYGASDVMQAINLIHTEMESSAQLSNVNSGQPNDDPELDEVGTL